VYCVATIFCKFCEGARQGEAIFSILEFLQWRYVEYNTSNFLLYRDRYLVVSLCSQDLVVDIFKDPSLVWEITRCLPILPVVLPFCLVLSHYGRCFPILSIVFLFPRYFPFSSVFPVSSPFSILLDVFHFAWSF
jgi:hypothetical protein